jgi:hypothetical protein
MHKHREDVAWLLMATVAYCGMYATLLGVHSRAATLVELAALLQTVCLACGVIGLLLSEGNTHRP